MSDYVADTPPVTRPWCPGCAPDDDPLVDLLEERWCDYHRTRETGLDDGLVSLPRAGVAGTEAHGADCREVQRMIR